MDRVDQVMFCMLPCSRVLVCTWLRILDLPHQIPLTMALQIIHPPLNHLYPSRMPEHGETLRIVCVINVWDVLSSVESSTGLVLTLVVFLALFKPY